MPHADFDPESLAAYLHVSPQQVLKMAERGSVPGRKIGGQWRFSQAEIHHWLEERIGAADNADLAHVQGLLDKAAEQKEPATVRISELLAPEAVAIPLPARTRGSVIKSMVELAAKTGHLWDVAEMAEAVEAREKLHPTALDIGVALLHPRRPLGQILAQPLLALGRTPAGIPFGSERGQLTDVFFLICSVDDSQHLRTLARLSRLIWAAGFLDELRAAEIGRRSRSPPCGGSKAASGNMIHAAGQPTIWMAGDWQHADFADAMRWLGERAGLLRLPLPLGEGRGEDRSSTPTQFSSAQSRAWSDFARRTVEHVHARAPLARLVVLVGPWCEGERSGCPGPA